jgi:hypothetical protein
VLDPLGRHGRKVDTLPEGIIEKALAKVITIFE